MKIITLAIILLKRLHTAKKAIAIRVIIPVRNIHMFSKFTPHIARIANKKISIVKVFSIFLIKEALVLRDFSLAALSRKLFIVKNITRAIIPEIIVAIIWFVIYLILQKCLLSLLLVLSYGRSSSL